jgi:hypothetical protein
VEPGLQVLLVQVHEFLGIERPATPTSPDALIADPSPVDGGPPRGPLEEPETPVRKGSLRKFRDKFRQLLAKFSRANQGPITLSSGLVPEREENAKTTEKRFAKLFGKRQNTRHSTSTDI